MLVNTSVCLPIWV